MRDHMFPSICHCITNYPQILYFSDLQNQAVYHHLNTDWLCSGGLFFTWIFHVVAVRRWLRLQSGLFQLTSPKSASPASLSVSFFVSPRGFSSVTDSGDFIWWFDLQSCVSPKRWRPISLWLQKPCKVTSTTSTGQDHHKNSQVQGTWQTLLLIQTFWNHHTLFKYRSKHTDTHTNTHTHNSFQAFHYWVPWIFSMIQTHF